MISTNGNNALLSLETKRFRFGLQIALVLLILGTATLLYGYSEKEKGIKSAEIHDFSTAAIHFSNAINVIPWSNTSHYELSKAYILEYKETGNIEALQLAKAELSSALHIAPRQILYLELEKMLKK